MAIVGINPTDYAPRKRSPLESIAIGAQIVNSVLGAAASAGGLYSELFGDKADLYKSQIKKNEADTVGDQNTKRLAIEKQLVDQFEGHDTVRAVNNLNDIYLTAREFANKGGISAEAKIPFVAKYMQAMNPKAGIRLNSEGTGFATEGLEAGLKQALQRWNEVFNKPEGLRPETVRGMMKAIEVEQSSLLGKFEDIRLGQERRAAEQGVQFNPMTRVYGVAPVRPEIDQNVLNSLKNKLRK